MIYAAIKTNIHMGDKIMCCLVLSNYAINNNIELKVYSCSIVRDLCYYFEIKNLKIEIKPWQEVLEIMTEKNATNLSIKDFFSFLSNTKVKCFNFPFIFLSKVNLKNSSYFQIPKFNFFDKKNITTFQLDNRSFHKHKLKLSKQQQIKFIKDRARFQPLGIGGEDTNKILPYNYSLGNLENIIKLLKISKQFVGVDSGVSHLASILNIPSEIFITHTKSKDIDDIKNFYSHVYNNKINFFDCYSKLLNFKILL